MRGLVGLCACLVLLAGCAGGGESSSAEEVVRAWSKALNAGDNDRAADLFASGAKVSQGDVTIRLETHEDAVRFNAALPCDGTIVNLETKDDTVTATFLLSDSETAPCDGPGQEATALFTIRDGKIVSWQQVAGVAEPPGDAV